MDDNTFYLAGLGIICATVMVIIFHKRDYEREIKKLKKQIRKLKR